MVISVFLVVMELFTALYSGIPEHLQHFKYLYFGLDGNTAMVAFTWISSLLAVLSLILLINPKTRNNLKILPVACVMVFASLWIEKGLELVVVGFIPSPLGTVTEYMPTFPELMISMGVYALGALVITVLYKIAISIKGGELPEIAKTSSKEVAAETV
jgi:molybdopterin-containing oxidoreductase family membrane subunit